MDANDILQLDLSFTSPTAAGTFILGGSAANGPVLSGSNVQGQVNPLAALQQLFKADPRYHRCAVYATLQGATGGTLDVYLQTSPDLEMLSGGGTWWDKLHFTQQVAGGGANNYAVTFSKTNPSTGIASVGKGNAPALAQNTKVDGDWGWAWRVVIVAGAGTSAGAAQVLKLYFSP